MANLRINLGAPSAAIRAALEGGGYFTHREWANGIEPIWLSFASEPTPKLRARWWQ